MPTEVPEAVQKAYEEVHPEFPLFPDRTPRSLEKLADLIAFIEREREFWEGVDQDIYGRFCQVRTSLVNAVKHAERPEVARREIEQASAVLNSGSAPKTLLPFSETATARFLKETFEQRGAEAYEGAKGYLLTGNVPLKGTMKQPGTLVPSRRLGGVIDAYNFRDLAETARRHVQTQEESLLDIQSRFSQLHGECDEQRQKHAEEFGQFSDRVKAWLTESKEGFDGLLTELEQRYGKTEAEWTKRVEGMEELYREKLALEAPCKQWEEFSKQYGDHGRKFALAAVLVGFTVMVFLGLVLYNWPPILFESAKWNLNTVKGAILLLSMTSLGIYLVHMLARFCVSSYHLQRDAQERRQLTYVYLALLEKGAFSDEQMKQFVLQALFSRAETGLLRGDHSPEMPSTSVMTLVDKVLKAPK